MKQGTKANRNGFLLEDCVRHLTEYLGFVTVPHSSYEAHPEDYEDLDRLLFTNVPFTSIYGHRGRTEFVLMDRKTGREIRIEVKLQMTQGSVDEKYAYIFWNAAEAYPEKEVILLVEGNGMKDGVRDFLQDKIDNNTFNFRGKGKEIYLMGLGSYITFLLENFKDND